MERHCICSGHGGGGGNCAHRDRGPRPAHSFFVALGRLSWKLHPGSAERRSLARRRRGVDLRASHGLHQLRDRRCRCPAELERAAAAGEPHRVQWRSRRGAMFRIATSNAAVQNIDGVRRTDGSHAHLHLACRSHRACGDWLRLIADFLAFEHGGPCKGQDPLPARNPPQLQGYEGSSCSRLNERHLAHSIGARRGPDRSARS
jgi:hypothetical protein